MTLQEYLTSLRHKTVAVIGIGVSNTPLLRRLLAEGIAVTACDRSSREKLGPLADELEAAGATLHLGEGYLDGLTQDVIFRTPGLRPDVPQLLAAQRQGSTLTGEMEVFFQVCPCHMIAVTGSDGKTTTTTIIAELLKAAGRTVHVGGNIGQPLLCQADDMEPEDWAVLELSSFQLMTMDRSPHIAVVTNLAPNHLDVHKDMAEYVAAKENIFRYQRPGDIAVFNQDNDITRQQALRAVGAVRLFSRRSEPEEGVFLRGPWTGWCRTGASGTSLAPSTAWSIASSWYVPITGCGTITTPSPPAPPAPLPGCAPSRSRSSSSPGAMISTFPLKCWGRRSWSM